MKKIAIVGSVNTDFIAKTKQLPRPGETVIGDSFVITHGGKGANKAVACARLGAEVTLFANVGDDDFSKRALANLKKEKVNVKNISSLANETCGIANICTGANTNAIVVVPGANGKVSKKYIDSIKPQLLASDIVAAELEVPQSVISYVAKICKKENKPFVLNPSPVTAFDKRLIDDSAFLIVNEVEIAHLPRFTTETQTLKEYNGRLILTKGGDGVFFYEDNKVQHIPAIPFPLKDSTGAGDTFLGAFLLAYEPSRSLREALEFANFCAGLKITKVGAQTGMPFLQQVYKESKTRKINLIKI